MLTEKKIKCNLAISKDILEILRNSRRIELFLDNIPSTRIFSANQHSYLCSRLNLLIDHNQMFNLYVKEIDFGTVMKEFFTIGVEEGWRKIKLIGNKRTREVEEGIVLSLQDYDLNHSISYDSCEFDGVLDCIKVVSNDGQIIDESNNVIGSFEEDIGILLPNCSQNLYIGCYEIPHDLIITKDKKLISQLTDGKKIRSLTDYYPLK